MIARERVTHLGRGMPASWKEIPRTTLVSSSGRLRLPTAKRTPHDEECWLAEGYSYWHESKER